MEERRRLTRHVVNKPAKIGFDDQSSLIDCIVRDLSSSGACLQFPAPLQAPELFELSFDNFRSTRACRVAWRQPDRLGVCFA
jgi:hypothetical protein